MLDTFFSTLVSFRRSGRSAPFAFAAIAPAARLEAEATEKRLQFGYAFTITLDHRTLHSIPLLAVLSQKVFASHKPLLHQHCLLNYNFKRTSLDHSLWWFNKCRRLGLPLSVRCNCPLEVAVSAGMGNGENIVALIVFQNVASLQGVCDQFRQSWLGIRRLELCDIGSWDSIPLNLAPLGEMQCLEALAVTTPVFDASSLRALHRCQHLTNVSLGKGLRPGVLQELCSLPMLRNLSLSECSSINGWSPLLSHRCLESLSLYRVEGLPEVMDVSCLFNLRGLSCSLCGGVRELVLPENDELEYVGVVCGTSLAQISNLDNRRSLGQLDVYDNNKLTVLNITGSTGLDTLSAMDCGSLIAVLGLETATSLRALHLDGSPVVSSSGVVPGDASGARFLPGIPFAATLEELSINRCDGVVDAHLAHFLCLRSLCLSHLRNLNSVSGLQHLVQLRNVQVHYCPNLTSVDCTALLALETLSIVSCDGLNQVQGITNKPFLREVFVGSCASVQSVDLGRSPSLVRAVFYSCSNLTSVTRMASWEEFTPEILAEGCPLLLEVVGFARM